MASAVGAREGNLTFYANIRREAQFLGSPSKALGVGFGVGDREGEGSGKYQQSTPQAKIVRPVVDFSAFLENAVAGRTLPPPPGGGRPPAVVVKMDIEGVEFAIAPRLLESRALCAVNFISIEWHTRAKFLPFKLEDSNGSAIWTTRATGTFAPLRCYGAGVKARQMVGWTSERPGKLRVR